jgi:TetR/AcrR family transcriptional regulator, tetracycline repressor protein
MDTDIAKGTTDVRVRERLTRDRVVAAALGIMDTEGLEAVSMRRVGRELGVEAMSLYNHVSDKEDLLDAMRERLLMSFALPELVEDDPYENGRRIAHAWRDQCKAHPTMIELLAGDHAPPRAPEAFLPMEMTLGVLRSMGVPDPEMMQVFHAFGGYIQGHVMMEHQLDVGKFGGEPGLQELAKAIDPAVMPCMAAAIPYMADCDLEVQFDLGLELMLGGLRTRYGDR